MAKTRYTPNREPDVIDRLIAEGVLKPHSRGWYQVLDRDRLPEAVAASISAIATGCLVKISAADRRALPK